MQFPQKHTGAETTIFTKMSQLATEHGAINLSQGFPDFPIDNRLSEFLYQATVEGYNQYAPMAGMPMLREAIAEDLLHRKGLVINADQEVTITPGATYALYTAIASIVTPGDEVIILEPAYDSYIPAIEMNGGVPVCVPLMPKTFKLDINALSAAITPKTVAIITNSPNNPTGAIWSAADMQSLEVLAEKHNLFIISDEVYEQLLFDGQAHHSVLAYPALRERSIAIFSFGKAFQQTGWKMGYSIAPAKITRAFRKLHQYICFAVNTPAQVALAKYLSLADKPDMAALIQNKRDFFLEAMRGLPFTMEAPAAGSYFQVLGYNSISQLADSDFATWLCKDVGVATIPVSAFYKNGKDDRLIRFCFAKKEETLSAAVEKLKNAIR